MGFGFGLIRARVSSTVGIRVGVGVRVEDTSDGMRNAAEVLVMYSHNPLASSSLQTPTIAV